MIWRILRFGFAATVAAVFLPATAHALPKSATPPAKAKGIVIRPLTLLRVADMDFATIAVTTGGSATINPVSGNMTVTSGLVHMSGTPSPARYAGAGVKNTVVNIKVPNKPVLITRIGGTEKLSVSAFTLDGQNKRTLASQPSFQFAVGATITVPAGTVEGIYEGTIDVTVQYP